MKMFFHIKNFAFQTFLKTHLYTKHITYKVLLFHKTNMKIIIWNRKVLSFETVPMIVISYLALNLRSGLPNEDFNIN